jgi:hypothetical protein
MISIGACGKACISSTSTQADFQAARKRGFWIEKVIKKNILIKAFLTCMIFAAMRGGINASEIEAMERVFDSLAALPKDSPDSVAVKRATASDSVKGANAVSSSKTKPPDTGHGAALADSSVQKASDAEKMYRASAPVMRRDVSVAGKAPDTGAARPKQEKHAELMITPPPQPARVDSFLMAPGERQASSGPKTHVSKSGVFIVIGACAVVGGAVAYYLVRNSQDKSAVAINNRIPPPPDPPAGGILFSP